MGLRARWTILRGRGWYWGRDLNFGIYPRWFAFLTNARFDWEQRKRGVG